MIPRHLVVPYSEEILFRLGVDQSVVPVVENLQDLPLVIETLTRAGSSLQCVEARPGLPLGMVPLSPDWKEVPIALWVPSIGRFPEVADRLALLRQLKVRIYLPAANPDNIVSARILSSLGVETALDMDSGPVDWRRMGDLSVYALFGRASHSPIAPFSYMAEHYDPAGHGGFSAVTFDDPERYLHLDAKGRVACTRRDLREGRFIAEDVGEIGDLEQNPAYRKNRSSWREFFLAADGCAYCPGWRLCHGRFDVQAGKDGGCRAFFTDLMDLLEQHRKQKGERETRFWQP